MTAVPPHDGWTLRAVAGDVPAPVAGAVVPATVPGCVHTDLLAAGLIPDPYLDRNEEALAWIGRADWRYETALAADPPGPGERVDLVCEGLDTVATVELAGPRTHSVELGRTANMHRSYRFDLTAALAGGGAHRLAVTFRSALAYATEREAEAGPLPHTNHHPYNQVRKMACNFGWDWGPDLVTAGIWRPVRLHRWRGARLAEVRPLATVDGRRGRVAVHVRVERAEPGPVTVTARVGDAGATLVLAPGEDAGTLEVTVEDVERWWPRGYGRQPLYPVRVVTGDDTWDGAVGFRAIELDTGHDTDGTRFTLRVNGQPVFARGANWIPDDCFPHRVDRARYAARLEAATGAGINLLRVWGGGIYESDDFYDLCDRLGILVWQDFALACAAYPEEEPLRGEIAAEAREQVTRLAPHPSLVLWNGGNENAWLCQDRGWLAEVGDRTWGLGYALDLLPRIVAALDPTRPYLANSPWSLRPDRHPNDPDHGTMHLWDVWNQRDYLAYREHVPRFVAEFGFQGPPAWATLRRAVHDEPLRPDSPGMLAHQKAPDGQGKLARGLAAHFPPPATMADWHWATQLNQARAVQLAVEHFRSWSPRCAGSVVWQLNDCWPVTSWALVDGDGRRKPAWYALRHGYADRLLTVQPRRGGLAVVAVNDTGTPWTATIAVSRRHVRGDVLAERALALDVPARGTATLPLPAGVATPAEPAAELLVAAGGGTRALWFYLPDRELALPPAGADRTATPVDGGYRVTVTARTLLRDVAVLADRAAPAAEVDDMLVTLLPGESTAFVVRTAERLDPDALLAPGVLRTANDLLD